MSATQYIALLRGINVGGNNIIKMSALRDCFESLGYHNVRTYIQSGNVLFTANTKNKLQLENTIEASLAKKFNYASRVVLVTRSELQRTVEKAPRGFGKNPAEYRYDVVFLKQPVTPKIVQNIEIKEGVDTVFRGQEVIYFSRLVSRATQSKLSKLMQMPEYKYMTIRNWNTVTKLLMLSAA